MKRGRHPLSLHPRKRQDFATQKAFSLLEILMIMGIISIISGLFLVLMKPPSAVKELISAGNQVSDLVSQARLQAVTLNTVSSLLFIQRSEAGETYWSVLILKRTTDRSWIPVKKLFPLHKIILP